MVRIATDQTSQTRAIQADRVDGKGFWDSSSDSPSSTQETRAVLSVADLKACDGAPRLPESFRSAGSAASQGVPKRLSVPWGREGSCRELELQRLTAEVPRSNVETHILGSMHQQVLPTRSLPATMDCAIRIPTANEWVRPFPCSRASLLCGQRERHPLATTISGC